MTRTDERRKQDAEAQRKRRAKLKGQGLEQVTVWVPASQVERLRSYAARLCEGQDDPEPPITDRQFAWAARLAERVGEQIPTSALASYRALSAWISERRYAPSCDAWKAKQAERRAAKKAADAAAILPSCKMYIEPAPTSSGQDRDPGKQKRKSARANAGADLH